MAETLRLVRGRSQKHDWFGAGFYSAAKAEESTVQKLAVIIHRQQSCDEGKLYFYQLHDIIWLRHVAYPADMFSKMTELQLSPPDRHCCVLCPR
jgi:hypothetical protein